MGLVGTFVYLIVVTLLTELTKPKPDLELAKPKNLGDFRFPTATEGRPVPIIWGDVLVEGMNVVWYGDLQQIAIGQYVPSGFYDTKFQIQGYKYKIGVQRALCMGEVDSLEEFHVGDSVVYSTQVLHDETFTVDEPELFGGDKLGQGGYSATLHFYAGTSNQDHSFYLSGIRLVARATIQAAGSSYAVGDKLTDNSGTANTETAAQFRVTEVDGGGGVVAVKGIVKGIYLDSPPVNPVATSTDGVGSGCTLNLSVQGSFGFQSILGENAPGYHDICYTANDREPGEVGTSTTPKPEKYRLRRNPNPDSVSGGNASINGGANPVSVIYELLTSPKFGYGEPTADVDAANFLAVSGTLATEGNGFSFIWSRMEDIGEMIRRVEEQIDGIVYKNPITGKWQIKLIRDDYNILTIPDIDDSNIVDMPTFVQATWEGTVNTVRVPFIHAADSFKESYGFAQDKAGVLILGKSVVSEIVHPGVNNPTQADDIAWRELRTLSVPLATAVFVIDRSIYGLLPGDVVAFTNADMNATRVPMRITSIDYGEILNDEIRIECVQDVFSYVSGSFGAPPDSEWENPGSNVEAFPVDEQFAIEQPYALTRRDQFLDEAFVDRFVVGARRQAGEVAFDVYQRNDPTSTSGAYSLVGLSEQFFQIGALPAALAAGSAYPLTSLTVFGVADQSEVLDAFVDFDDPLVVGTYLANLCVIDPGTASEEFIILETAQISGDNILLGNVYRGVLDSAQKDHAAGAPIFVLSAGVAAIEQAIPAGNFVDVKLLPKTATTTLDIGDATEISFQMDSRTRRPIPPASFDLNGTTLDTTNVDLDGSGSGEDVGILVDEIRRRDHRTANEVNAVTLDAAVIASDFPSAFSYETEVEMRNGATVLSSETGITGQSVTMRQLDILAGLDETSLPSSLTIALRGSHTFDGSVLKSRSYMELTFTVDSPLIGKHAFGELDDSEITGNAFVVVAPTVDHVFNLSTSFTVGDVEYRINGGSWLTLIAAGGTGPGTIPNASLSASDTIEIRHLSTDTAPQKLLTMTVSGTAEAYAVLIS